MEVNADQLRERKRKRLKNNWCGKIEFKDLLKNSHSGKGRVVRALALQVGGQQFEPPQMYYGVFFSSIKIEWR